MPIFHHPSDLFFINPLSLLTNASDRYTFSIHDHFDQHIPPVYNNLR